MNLRTAILHGLNVAGPKGIPEFALKIEARLRLGRTPGETEWASEITHLEERGWVARDVDPITDDPHLTITDAGKKAFNQPR
jgi:hypothetical protein